MCSIAGLEGNFKASDLTKMLKSSKNRGIDSSGVFLAPDTLENNIDLDDYENDSNLNFAMGHNLLSIFKLENSEFYQPVSKDNLVLVFNGEIYNFRELAEFLNSDFSCDTDLLLNLACHYFKKSGNLLEAVKKTVSKIDGDYSFVIWDGKNLAIARDDMGVKPLFYAVNNNLKGFSSTRKSLREVGFSEIISLKPGNILYNWKEVEFRAHPWQITENIDISNLKELLFNSVSKRVEFLEEIAVIFSGGVDSAILTLILKKIASQRDLKIRLYSVGGKNSKDVQAARKLASQLHLPLKVHDISEETVKENLSNVINAIDDTNLMKIGVGMTIYLASKMIKEDGLKVAISGQGADELFAGYNRYLKSFESGDLDEELRHDIENMYHVNLERDDAVSMDNGVELRLPFLDSKLVEFALNIPVEYKIIARDDKIRKHILRNLASELGLDDEFAFRPKKAAQYGTGIDKILRKKIIKNYDLNSFL